MLRELAAQQSRLETATALAQDAQKRSKTLQAELSSETDRLLAERQVAFDTQKVAFDDISSELEKQLQKERIALEATKAEHKHLKGETQVFAYRVKEQREQLEALVEQKRSLQPIEELKTTLMGDVNKLHRDILALDNELSGMIAEKAERRADNEQLQAEKTHIEAKLVELNDTIGQQLLDQSKQLELYEQKIVLKRQEYEQFDKDMDKQREELGRRQKAADERDVNLRVREHRVTHDEQTIQTNSSLLNL